MRNPELIAKLPRSATVKESAIVELLRLTQKITFPSWKDSDLAFSKIEYLETPAFSQLDNNPTGIFLNSDPPQKLAP